MMLLTRPQHCRVTWSKGDLDSSLDEGGMEVGMDDEEMEGSFVEWLNEGSKEDEEMEEEEDGDDFSSLVLNNPPA